MDLTEVTCPTCFELFQVARPPEEELPVELDYDCEVCCRPMLIVISHHEAWAKSLAD